MVVLAKAHYKVGKFPSWCGVSIQQLQSDYKAPEFLAVLKQFLNSHATRDNVVSPVESDQFDVFNHLYVENSASVVTGHGSSWQNICAKLKVAADGRKAKTPSKFDTAFVWDEGHQPGDSFGPNGTYLTSSTPRMCTDKHFSNPYHTSACHLQTSKSSWSLPASTGLR